MQQVLHFSNVINFLIILLSYYSTLDKNNLDFIDYYFILLVIFFSVLLNISYSL